MFKGSIVALITPFKNNVLDQDKYASLIHHHIKNGTNGVVPAGTTGESPTGVLSGIATISALTKMNKNST